MKEFEELCKLSSGYVTSMRKGYGQEKLNNVLTVFPELNREWLLYGEGSMLNEDLSCTSSLKKKEEKSDTRPRIPYDAAAGTLTETIEGVTEYQCEEVPVISAFPHYDFTIRVVGRSMEPEYFAGDEVACLKVNEKRFLQWGRVHVLDTTQGVVIKRIYDDGDCITCRSYNPEFPDFSIPKEDIRSYNLVVGSLRL
uniref:S24 family peptidase n=1 Tax=Phocaeicola plebeius TaxID=310297 RepID=UPI003FF117B6